MICNQKGIGSHPNPFNVKLFNTFFKMKNLSNSTTSAQRATNVVLTGKAEDAKKGKETPAVLIVKPLVKEESKEERKQEKAVQTEQLKPAEEAKPQVNRLTMDEIDDKAERLYLLHTKRQEIKDKRKQIEKFTISHDKNNAQLTLIDANGLSITTSNPQSIGKLLVDWMGDLDTCLATVEEDMRKELTAAI